MPFIAFWVGGNGNEGLGVLQECLGTASCSGSNLGGALLRSGSHSHSNAAFAVISGTVKTAVRGAGNKVTITVALANTYKAGALSLPAEGSAATLRFEAPCRQCPILKKGERPPHSPHTCPFTHTPHQLLPLFPYANCAEKQRGGRGP